MISENDRKAGLGKEASNSISELVHAAATQSLKPTEQFDLTTPQQKALLASISTFIETMRNMSKPREMKRKNQSLRGCL
jgi:hypothetical protein